MRLLIRFAKWCENRWPEQLVITQELYNDTVTDLQETLMRIHALEKRVAVAEANIVTAHTVATDANNKTDQQALALGLGRPDTLPSGYGV